jgi:hypothetical protein
MSISAFSGPLITFGQSPFPGQEYNSDLGPSLFSVGAGILDPRLAFTYLPGQDNSSFTAGWVGFDNIMTLNAVPYTASSSAIVASANPTSATLTLVSANSATTGVSITNTLTNTATGQFETASLVALDSFASFTGSISGTTLTVTANSAGPISVGMVLLTAGGTGTLSSGVTVTGFLTGTGFAGTYTVSLPQTIGSGTITANLPNVVACTATYGLSNHGPDLWNPMALLGRAVSVTAAASATYATATVTGYDVYGFPMSEAITITAGSTVNGKKGFKYIKSVVLSGGTADTTHAYSVGTADVFAFPLRSDNFGDVLINSAASLTATTLITAATNYLPAVTTTPATTTTGDVRGTFAATSATGANRLVVRQSIAPYNIGTITGLYGTTQA